jgi:DNA-binding MarR family transcriptional regulator
LHGGADFRIDAGIKLQIDKGGIVLLERSFTEIYIKFKLSFYSKIFSRFETREASLTAVETFCAEVIHALRHPTVNEFARFVSISPPNATHKIQSLIKKGYVVKSQSPDDKREYTLSVTDKFFQYYNVSAAYIHEVIGRVKQHFTTEELSMLERFFDVINQELMPEVPVGICADPE